MDPQYDNTNDLKLLGDSVFHQENCIPSIRPSMDTGNLPQEISLCNSRKVEEILKTGDVVEAWTNDRYF